jgi:hypothetical protein
VSCTASSATLGCVTVCGFNIKYAPLLTPYNFLYYIIICLIKLSWISPIYISSILSEGLQFNLRISEVPFIPPFQRRYICTPYSLRYYYSTSAIRRSHVHPIITPLESKEIDMYTYKCNAHHRSSPHSPFNISSIASGSIDSLNTLLSTIASAASFIAFLLAISSADAVFHDGMTASAPQRNLVFAVWR